jgi:hypothetical protein
MKKRKRMTDASLLDTSIGLNLRDSLLNAPRVDELSSLLGLLPEAQPLRSTSGDKKRCLLPSFQIIDVDDFETPRMSHFDPDELKFLEKIQVKQQTFHESNLSYQAHAPFWKEKRDLSDLTLRHKIGPVDSPQQASGDSWKLC